MNNVRNWFIGTASLVIISSAMLSACSSDDSSEATISTRIENMSNKVQEASQTAGDSLSEATDGVLQ